MSTDYALPTLYADAIVVGVHSLLDAQCGILQPPAEDFDPGEREEPNEDLHLNICPVCDGSGEEEIGSMDRDGIYAETIECGLCRGSGEVLR